jgi:Flp pilus assembly protein TadD
MAHTRLAQLYESVQRWPVAIAERQAAVNANPDDPSLVYDLGVTLAKGAQWAQGDSTLRQAMAANPRDSRVPYYLGIVEQQLGKKDEARTAFQRFLALAPSRYQVQIDNAKQRLAALQ